MLECAPKKVIVMVIWFQINLNYYQFARSANAKEIRSPRLSPDSAVQREGFPNALGTQMVCAEMAPSLILDTSSGTMFNTEQRDVSARTDFFSSKY